VGVVCAHLQDVFRAAGKAAGGASARGKDKERLMLLPRQIQLALFGLALAVAFAAPTGAFQGDAEVKGVGGDDSAFLVNDAEMIFKVNVKQLMGSKLVQDVGTDKIKEAINSNAELKNVIDATGLDVTKDLHSVLVSAAGTNPADIKAQIAVRGKFDTDKIQKVLAKREGVTAHKVGGKDVYEFETRNGPPMFAAFVDNSTLVLTPNKDTTAELAKGTAKKGTLGKQMKTALSKFTGKESLAIAVVFNEEARKQLAGLPKVGESVGKMQILNAAVTITDAITLNVTGVTNDAEASKALAALLDGLKGTAKMTLGRMEELPPDVVKLLDSVKIANTNDNVTVDLKVPKETIDKLKKGGKTR